MELKNGEQGTPVSVLIRGESIRTSFLKYDFTKFGFDENDEMTAVGVFCPEDTAQPILIGQHASELYAKWSAVHEELCQRTNRDGTPCVSVERDVIDAMIEQGVPAGDMQQFVEARAVMFGRLLVMEGNSQERQSAFRQNLLFLNEMKELLS